MGHVDNRAGRIRPRPGTKRKPQYPLGGNTVGPLGVIRDRARLGRASSDVRFTPLVPRRAKNMWLIHAPFLEHVGNTPIA